MVQWFELLHRVSCTVHSSKQVANKNDCITCDEPLFFVVGEGIRGEMFLELVTN